MVFLIEQARFAEFAGSPEEIVCCVLARCRTARHVRRCQCAATAFAGVSRSARLCEAPRPRRCWPMRYCPERPLRQWVLSLPHALRFLLATNSEALTLVLGEVYRTISRHLIGKAGLTRTSGATGGVTLVQRFGSALNLNVHFHMVFLDGAYQTIGAAAPVFRSVAAPESSDLQQLVEQIAGRIGRALERSGPVERDLENAWLARDTEAGPLDDLLGHSITYRIAVGPRAGQKLFTLQTVAPRLQGPEGEPNGAARAGGFSLARRLRHCAE